MSRIDETNKDDAVIRGTEKSLVAEMAPDEDDGDVSHLLITDSDDKNSKESNGTKESKDEEEKVEEKQQQQQQQQSKASSPSSSFWKFGRTAREAATPTATRITAEGGQHEGEDDKAEKDTRDVGVEGSGDASDTNKDKGSAATILVLPTTTDRKTKTFWRNFVSHKATTKESNHTKESDRGIEESSTVTNTPTTAPGGGDDNNNNNNNLNTSTEKDDEQASTTTRSIATDTDDKDEKDKLTVKNDAKTKQEESDNQKNSQSDKDNDYNNEPTTMTDWIEAVKQRHEQLTAFEQERQKSFQSDFIALQAYTKVYGEIVDESLSEMQHIGGFVDGIWTAQQRFVEIMQEKTRQATMLSKQHRDNATTVAQNNSLTTIDPVVKSLDTTTTTTSTTTTPEGKSAEESSQRPTIQSTFDKTFDNTQLDIGLAPPSTISTVQTTALDAPLPSSSSSQKEEAYVAPLPSAFTPLIEALEVSQNLWESKFSTSNQQTAGPNGILQTLATTWPSVLQAQKEQLDRVRGKVFPTLTVKHEAVQQAWGTYFSPKMLHAQ
eukprot:scaffold2974_cov181-Amphora_coffeaeformis.AAC.10